MSLLVSTGVVTFAGVVSGGTSVNSKDQAASASTEVAVTGLTPDTWGTTVSDGSRGLRYRYPAIVRATCEGVRLVGYPRKESTWLADGERWWDKLACFGIAGPRSQSFSLIYDPTGKQVWRTSRLKSITLSELHETYTPPPAPAATPPPQTPPALPKPSTRPTPAPTDRATKLLLNEAHAAAIRIGRTFKGVRDSTGSYYFWHSDRSECGQLARHTGRCWLYLWKQAETPDSNSNIHIERHIFLIHVFAVDLGRRAYSTFSNQQNYLVPWRVVCSDVAATGAPRCT